MSKPRGKLIVIDGTDGSGKATQTRLLVYRLKKLGYKVETLDFPQYNTKSAGLIEEYLNGKYGQADEVNPYAASCFYACDRFDAGRKIKEWLNDGKIVVIDRYVTSNLAHQGCKLRDPLERKNFYDWLTDLEFNIFQIPCPDLTLILHVDAAIAQKLSQKRQEKKWLDQKRDIHEEELTHLERAELIYLEIVHNFKNTKLIECVRDQVLLSISEIDNLIWREIKTLLQNSFHHYHSSDLQTWPQRIFIRRLSPKAKFSQSEKDNRIAINLHSAEYHSLLPGKKTMIKTDLEIITPDEFSTFIYKNQPAQTDIHVIPETIPPNTKKEIIIQLINLSADIFHIAPGQIIAEILLQEPKLLEIIEDDASIAF